MILFLYPKTYSVKTMGLCGKWALSLDCGTQSGQWGTLVKHLSNGLLNTILVISLVKQASNTLYLIKEE